MEKGIYYSRWGGPEELRFGTLPERKCIDPDRIKLNSGEILLQIRAISVNPIDWKILSGSQKPVTLPLFPRIFGTDFAGTVYRAGAGAQKKGFSVGTRVMGLVSPLNKGSGRQWLKVRADHCLIMPESVSFEEGAALPEACISALLATSFSRKMKPGKALLFGASGGVGSAVLQILASRGWDVSAVCRDDQKSALRHLGARECLDRYSWRDELSGKPEWDAVVDCPAAVIRDNPSGLLKKGGVYAPVYIPDSFIPFQIIRTLLWFFTPYKTSLFIGYPSKGRMRQIQMLLQSATFKPLIDSIHIAENIVSAVDKSRRGGVLGKIIVTF
ncbi:NAD(P)-dependent alcohol dehydrogenase [Spirochaeta isovalerica]|uniref:NADPH:quinone reductase-like Zn-dependent oxidoreductase n=1 Tax=Spirochaeta isovalerica TaxID=150 RepID=A0A841RCC7_9SPIO|nr:NAD(P)-dependent alcohol dehydrogenase [Spirochaeta isovalerica]MBB6480052.1 NADPH:quinone reductase-like Zn-dependent oxidoreductase [Spirochaeta isovalerica]